MQKIQSYLYEIFEEPSKNKIGYFANIFIYTLIIISILNIMLSSVQIYNQKYGFIFICIKNIVMPLFILEYFTRLFAYGKLDKYRGLSGKLRYIKTPFAIIDLLSILPFIFVGFGIDTSFIRSLRLLRVFRLFRIKKYATFILKMKEILMSKKEEFTILFFFTIIIIILLSFMIYSVEHEAQPKVFTNMFQTLWWAVATLTTVGYGDMYPITPIGKIITAFISIIGIAFVAIPGGIFASEFMSHISSKKDESEGKLKCPMCSDTNINSIKNKNIHIKDVNFDKIATCKSCNFSWLVKEKDESR